MGLVGGVLGGTGGFLSSLLSSRNQSAGSGSAPAPATNTAPVNATPVSVAPVNGAAGVPAAMPSASGSGVAAAVGSLAEVAGSRSVPEPVRAAGGTPVNEGAVRVDFGAAPVREAGDDARAYAIAAQAEARRDALVARLGAEPDAPPALVRVERAAEKVGGAGGMPGALDALRGREPAGGVLDKVV